MIIITHKNGRENTMDFLNRNGQSTPQSRPANQTTTPNRIDGVTGVGSGNRPHSGKHFGWGHVPGWLRVAHIVLLFSITILTLSVVLSLRNTNPNENQYVEDTKYQAVFLENGQVYFGRVVKMNSKFIDLQNVFYLNNTQSEDAAKKTSNQFTLVKLGCELHGPSDRMVVNRDHVTFWENLKDDGQVVKTIKEWIKQNPDGQTCTTTTDSTNQSTGTQQSNATTQTTSGTTTNKQN